MGVCFSQSTPHNFLSFHTGRQATSRCDATCPLYEVEKFENTAQRRRLSVKPGLTCLWQISGRNKVKDFGDWVKLDLEYIDRWSLGLDLKILLRTIPAVLFGLGAK